MAASVRHKFERGFILHEENLRGIDQILSEREKATAGAFSFKYRVFRSGNFSIDTEDISDVFKELEVSSERIIEFRVESKKSSNIEFVLKFDEDGTALTINGRNRDRDNVSLLFSNIRQYIEGNVNITRRKMEGLYPPITVFIGMTVMMIVLTTAIYFISQPDAIILENVLQSNDIKEKINYLIRQRISGKESLYLAEIITVTSFIIVVSIVLFNKILSFLFPTNLFLIGTPKKTFDRRIIPRSVDNDS